MHISFLKVQQKYENVLLFESLELLNSRKNGAVVSHDDFIQDRTDDAPVHIDLLGNGTKNLEERFPSIQSVTGLPQDWVITPGQSQHPLLLKPGFQAHMNQTQVRIQNPRCLRQSHQHNNDIYEGHY